MPSAGPPVSCRVAAAAALSIAPPASTPALRSCSAPSRPSGRGVPSGVGRAAMRSHARIRLSGHETPNTKRSFTQTTTEDVPGRPVGTASRRRGSLRPTPRAVPARPSLPTCRRCVRRATVRGSVRRRRRRRDGTDAGDGPGRGGRPRARGGARGGGHGGGAGGRGRRLAEPADTHGGAVSAGRRDGHAGAHRGAAPAGGARAAGGGGEPQRRLGRGGDGSGRARRAGR